MELLTLEKVVISILETVPEAREDDYVLMYYVCEKLNPEINSLLFGTAMYNHKKFNMPNWESVTRCRRKIQEKRPDLVSPEKAKKRRKNEERYREYAHT